MKKQLKKDIKPKLDFKISTWYRSRDGNKYRLNLIRDHYERYPLECGDIFSPFKNSHFFTESGISCSYENKDLIEECESPFLPIRKTLIVIIPIVLYILSTLLL